MIDYHRYKQLMDDARQLEREADELSTRTRNAETVRDSKSADMRSKAESLRKQAMSFAVEPSEKQA